MKLAVIFFVLLLSSSAYAQLSDNAALNQLVTNTTNQATRLTQIRDSIISQYNVLEAILEEQYLTNDYTQETAQGSEETGAGGVDDVYRTVYGLASWAVFFMGFVVGWLFIGEFWKIAGMSVPHAGKGG